MILILVRVYLSGDKLNSDSERYDKNNNGGSNRLLQGDFHDNR